MTGPGVAASRPLWARRSITDPYFNPDAGRLVPAPHAHSARSANHVHGRLLAGLLARAVEAEMADPELHCGRLTVDLCRPAPWGPLTVEVVTTRRGRRLQLIDAAVHIDGADGGPVARASALVLRRGELPPGEVWSAKEWRGPPPGQLPEADVAQNLPWELRAEDPAVLLSAERARVWIRDPRRLVAGEATSPWVRVAMVADATNPLANGGTRGLRYINADITLHLRRAAVGEWIGFEAAAHLAEAGLALGQCTLYDEQGPIGVSTVTAVASAPLGKAMAEAGSR